MQKSVEETLASNSGGQEYKRDAEMTMTMTMTKETIGLMAFLKGSSNPKDQGRFNLHWEFLRL